MKKSGIQIRDPFVLPVKEEGRYYLYGTTDKDCWRGKATGFEAYSSTDLENWDGPHTVFTPDKQFWADQNFWAPEVYAYLGRYYMFASFKAEGVCRGTQILVSKSPLGPFVPNSEGPVTPKDWECLDGTFYLDRDNNPWMVFCHEWVQVRDGEICAIRLDKELKRAIGEPQILFHASEAPWCKAFHRKNDTTGIDNYVTDGPYVYKAKDDSLLMLWSSFGTEGYAMGVARSQSGDVFGPWVHEKEPIYGKDGGHGMLFKTFDGKLKMTIHTPNQTPDERPVFINLTEQAGKLTVNSTL